MRGWIRKIKERVTPSTCCHGKEMKHTGRRITSLLLCLCMMTSMISSVIAVTAYASNNDSVMEGGIIIFDNNASGSSEVSSQTEAADVNTEDEAVIEADSETKTEAVVSGESGIESEETTATPDETETEAGIGDETGTEIETPEENTETSAPSNVESIDEATEKPEEDNNVSENDDVSGDDAETQGETPVKEHDYTSELEGDISVAVDLLEGTKLPDGALLELERLGLDAPEYADALSTVLESLALPEGSEPDASLYDIRFVANGKEVEPTDRVRVTVKFDGLSGDASGRTVVHVKDDGTAETLDAEWFDDGSVTFEVDSFSVFGFVNMLSDNGIQMLEAGANDSITWGTVEDVDYTDGADVRTWKVDETKKRYVDIPVKINASGQENLTVTLPKKLQENLRDGATEVEINTVSAEASNWKVDKTSDPSNVIITNLKTDEGGQHASVSVFYRFDCWNVISEKPFDIEYTIKKGEESSTGKLTGKIVTGYKVGFDEYYFSWGDSAYSLSAFGGADKYMSYISGWATVYKKYFDIDSFDTENYLYDVAPFLVKPEGQQPYDISGTLTLDQGGEVLGAVYMMDSVKGSDAPWKKIQCTQGENNSYTFNFGHNDEFENKETDFTESYKHDINKLQDAVVTGDLTDPVDNKNYTLYFLVRYPKTSLQGEMKGSNEIIDLKAKLSVTHTGVDDRKTQATAEEKSQTIYQGNKNVDPQIYFASYTNAAVNNRKAISALEKGMPVNLDFAVDFFCLNEARKAGSKSEKYALEAIIDLSYITGGLSNDRLLAPQLASQEYRFSAVDITLVDAPGSWSQDWNYQNDATGGWKGTPNVGWTLETWNQPPSDKTYDEIYIYGSTSLEEDSWTEIKRYSAAEVWALNQDRNFRTGQGSTEFTIETENYVRLKVVYNSQYTTALRVGYQLELQPKIFSTHSDKFNKNTETQELTCWFNYMGYKNGQVAKDNADTDYMSFERFPYSDVGWDGDGPAKGTAELARQYDNRHTSETGYNEKTGRGETGYSLRNFAKATLGRFEESAGMLITQALYDSTGKLVGDPNSIDLSAKDSYALKDSVINVSEIVFNISGALTDGSSNMQELQEYKNWLNKLDEDQLKANNGVLGSKKALYNSTKMRYFVLLPPGMTLNLDPDEGYQTLPDSDDPLYHFWTTGTDKYLSASSSFYNNNSSKVVQGGATDVPVSKSNIPGWTRHSANGNLSEMYWEAGTDKKTQKTGKATVVNNTEENQLVIFERELAPIALNERFNLWGQWNDEQKTSEINFWGRGLSFSIVPEMGTGTLAPGNYTTYVWCQYLDDDGKPINIDGFRTGTFDITDDTVDEDDKDVNVELLNQNGGGSQDANTLLYIPIDFKNRSGSGSTYASISLESDVKNENGRPIVQFGKDYAYKLHYAVESMTSKNVVLWTNIEQEYDSKPQYRGTVTGVDLTPLSTMGIQPENVRVYVRKDFFVPSDYTGISKADQTWLANDQRGWTEVPKDELKTYNWAEVKAIAFYFEGVEFNAATNPNSATVKIKMKGPERDDKYLDLDGQPEKTYYAVSPLIFSDTHQGDGDSDENACTAANEVVVSVTVRSLTLPATGGFGARDFVTVGLVFCMGGTAIYLRARRRRVRPGRGNLYRM